METKIFELSIGDKFRLNGSLYKICGFKEMKLPNGCRKIPHCITRNLSDNNKEQYFTLNLTVTQIFTELD